MKKRSAAAMAMLAASLIAATSAGACEPQNKFPTIEEGKLTVTLNVYPPFTDVSPEGEIIGIDSEVVKTFAAENCLEIEAIVLDQPAQIQSIITDKADVSIYAWSRTRARSEVMGLSDPMYLERLAIYSREGYDTVSSLHGKTVGVRAADFFAADFQKIPEINVRTYANQSSQLQDLESGRVDAIVDGYSLGSYLQKTKGAYEGFKIVIIQPDERVPFTVGGAQSTVLYSKNNEELGTALNATIARMREGGIIRDLLVSYGFDESLADVGEPAFIQ